jgi:putative transposase
MVEFMSLYKNKYRNESTRLKGWNYASNGWYFITMVVQHRICHLGQIQNGQMILSDFGKIVEREFNHSFELRSELKLDSYVIMPNHLHAVVVIDHSGVPISPVGILDNKFFVGPAEISPVGTTEISPVGTTEISPVGPTEISPVGPTEISPVGPTEISPVGPTEISPVGTHGRASQRGADSPKNDLMPIRQPKSLSSFVAGFKSSVNSRIDDYIDLHQINMPKFHRKNHFFQPNYHDRIIRNELECVRITQYILNNPQKWEMDSLR